MKISPQVLKFLGVGGTAALIHFTVALSLAYLADIGLLLSNAAGYLAAFSFSFYGQSTWTFASEKSRSIKHGAKFLIVSSSAFFINQGVLAAELAVFDHNFYIFLAIISAGCSACFSFFALKFWSFKD